MPTEFTSFNTLAILLTVASLVFGLIIADKVAERSRGRLITVRTRRGERPGTNKEDPMANNGSKYHGKVKVDIDGREVEINIFADTLPELFRDISVVTAQLPAGLYPDVSPAADETPVDHPKPRVVEPKTAAPACLSCGSADSMEFIEFRSKKDGQLKRAWKCQECNEWYYPPGSKRSR